MHFSFISFLHVSMFKFILQKGKNLIVLLSQYHAWWCRGLDLLHILLTPSIHPTHHILIKFQIWWKLFIFVVLTESGVSQWNFVHFSCCVKNFFVIWPIWENINECSLIKFEIKLQFLFCLTKLPLKSWHGLVITSLSFMWMELSMP